MRLPNGYGSIIKLQGKRRRPFAVRITTGYKANGSQVYKYLGYFEKRAEALTCLTAYNANPYDLDVKKITFNDIYVKWSTRHFENISNITLKNYKSAYNKCAPLYNMPFSEIKTAHLQAVVDAYKSSPSSARTLKIVLNHLFSYAIKNEIVEKDLSKFIEMPKNSIKHDKQPFTISEINDLWANLHLKFVDLLLILLYTGLRINELLSIKIIDVNIKERFLVGGSKTEAGRDRVVPLHLSIIPLIENNINKNKVYLFENTKHNKYRYHNLNARIVPTLNKLKLNHTLHETRHTFISQAHRLGLDNLIIKRIVGHSSKDITANYTHIELAQLIETIDNFNY